MRILPVLIPLLFAASAPAVAQTRVGEVIGPDRARAEAALAQQGYRLIEYEAEKGRLEIKAGPRDPKPGGRLEIVADARTGKILRVEQEGGGK